ncbi:MAG: ABC transporter permease [Acidimicrobiia bacterium]|nr:ABC transporter permease [Acidimicrobiia bacterium]
MSTFLQYTVLGLALSGAYFIAASGLVVTYTTSGIFNFAQGAIAMLAVFTYWQLRWGWGWPAPIALIVVLGVLAPLLGAGLYRVVMRNLRGTSDVTKIIVSIGVMLGFQALATWIWSPVSSTPRQFLKFFGPNALIEVGEVRIPWHYVISFAIAIAIAAGIRLIFVRTRSGVAMRAVVDDPDLLQLNGGRPERLAMLSWAGGAFLAALAGILIQPMIGSAMSASQLTLLVIDAFAAAMFGRLRSLPRTFVGALVIGLTTTYVVAYFPANWTWSSAFRQSLPMIFLFIVLIILPQDRLRGATILRTRERFRLPSMRTAWIAGLILVGVVFALRVIMAPTAVNTLTLAMTIAIIALSLVLLTGLAGEINLAVMSFGAIATVVAFHFGISGSGQDSRMTLWGIVIGCVVTAIVGAIIALPALRLRGLYLALATMAFGVFVSRMVLTQISEREIFGLSFTIFPTGQINIPKPAVGPIDFNSKDTFLMLVTVLFALLAIALVFVRHSGYGRRLAAMKDSPAACATLGMSVVRLKLSVFMLSAAIAGLGGILLSAQAGNVTADRFDILLSLSLMMITVVGGIGYMSGALFAGVFLVAFIEMLNGSLKKFAVDYAGLEAIFMFFVSAVTVLPATIGITMGKSPSGAVNDIVEGFSRLKDAKPVMYTMIGLEVLAYALTAAGVLTNWHFAIATIVVLFVVPPVGGKIYEKYMLKKFGVPPPVAAEMIGIERPYTDDDLAHMDRVLGLDAVVLPGKERVDASA